MVGTYLTIVNTKGDFDIDTSREGQLLIAHPNLDKADYFYKTVVYVYADNVAGTKGIVVNMPSVLRVCDVCDQRDIYYPDAEERVYQGGPLVPDAVVMLHTPEWESSNTVAAGPEYAISSDYHMFEKLADSNWPTYWRVFAGIASWAPGQLEEEISGLRSPRRLNTWLTATATDDILFEYEGQSQWEAGLDLVSQEMMDTFL